MWGWNVCLMPSVQSEIARADFWFELVKMREGWWQRRRGERGG